MSTQTGLPLIFGGRHGSLHELGALRARLARTVQAIALLTVDGHTCPSYKAEALALADAHYVLRVPCQACGHRQLVIVPVASAHEPTACICKPCSSKTAAQTAEGS